VSEERIPPETAHFKVVRNNSSPECLKVEVDLSSRCLFFFSPTFFSTRGHIHTLMPAIGNKHSCFPSTDTSHFHPHLLFLGFRHTHTPSADSLSYTSRRKYLDFNLPAAILAFCHFQDETILLVSRLEGWTCGVKTSRNHTMYVTKPSLTGKKRGCRF